MKLDHRLYKLLAISICSALLVNACSSGGSGSRGDIDSDHDGVLNSVDVDDDNNGLIEISSLDQLDAMRNDLTGSSLNGDSTGCPKTTGCNGYELVADLDFNTKPDFQSGQGWVPIGSANAFSANFSGNKHVIRNLVINNPGIQNIGLFGAVSGNGSDPVVIQDVTLENVNIIGGGLVGALVGRIDDNGPLSISNCSVSGTVVGMDSTNGSAIIGGLVGQANGPAVEITKSDSNASVSGDGNAIGGLVGYALNGTTISQSYATGDITVTGQSQEMLHGGIGGLVGTINTDQTLKTATSTTIVNIRQSFATGNIADATGLDNYIGGLVGISYYGNISNTYSTGTVNTNGYYIGGLLGDSNITTNIEYSYAANDVSGNTGNPPGTSNGNTVGRFVGYENASYTETYTDNYFITETAETSTGASGYPSQQMQQCPNGSLCNNPTLFSSWDTSIWDFGTITQLPGMIIDGMVYR